MRTPGPQGSERALERASLAAEQAFAALATDLRGRYVVEVVDHRRAVAPGLPAARAEEGPGMLVVTVLVASTEELPGRARCADCRAVYARELGRCPGCGAPAGGD